MNGPTCLNLELVVLSNLRLFWVFPTRSQNHRASPYFLKCFAKHLFVAR